MCICEDMSGCEDDISGGVDVPNGENEDVNPWLPLRDKPDMLDCPVTPKAAEGGGEKNRGGGGDDAKYPVGNVTSPTSRRGPRMVLMSMDRIPLPLG